MRAGSAACLAGLLLAAGLGAPATASAGKPRCNKTVNVRTGDDPAGNLFFSKSRVTIREGSCVRWIWTGTLDHQVEGRGVRSKLRTAPYRYKKRYAKARRAAFRLICTQHPISMRMRVKVLPKRP